MNSMLSMFALFKLFLEQIKQINFFILPKQYCAVKNIH
ncbi:hypothetical protein DESAMIL20_1979 [Desulfurella amilsii]|uniref:Uncharacterized protein n=1 Tax=Desulfurella amilsii TaxID=1562698 RepID=A0A1X4XY08_9BACT|nr:hypothetical protein DESAMIL20_1979 [Desulfurella amilsii]